MDPTGSAAEADGAVQARLSLYRYAGADNAAEYLALMRLFTGSLMADLSATEASALLAERGVELPPEEVELRCQQLERWGNLVRSVRDARVATVSEWLRSRARYQVSTLGGRVHRQVDEVLQAGDGAREVARELLGGMVATLDRLLAALDVPGRPDPDALAADVTTVFSSQQLFLDSARDFYAFLHQVLSRYDLAGAEYRAFKSLLLDYVDLLTADVARHAPVVTARLERVHARLPRLLGALDAAPALTGTGSTGEPQRSPGRTAAEWEALLAWYTGSSGASGPAQLRAAAEQALGQLLANAKRMLAAGAAGVSRRGDLLRLATLFDASDAQTAHRLFDTAFGAYPARHLLLGPDEDAGRAGAATSWWDAAPVDVPVSLRERGERTLRGRVARVPDAGLVGEALLAEARQEDERRRAAASELVTAGALDGARVSASARNLLLDRLADVLAMDQALDAPVTSVDSHLGVSVTAHPDPGGTTLHAPDGDLHVAGLALVAAAAGADGVPA